MKINQLTNLRALGISTLAIVLLLASCSPPAPEISATSTSIPVTSTPQPTNTPTDTPTPEPKVSLTEYSSDTLNLSLAYPSDWFISESDNYLIIGTREEYVNGPTPDSIDDGESRITLFTTSTDIQQQYSDPISALDGYTLFVGIEMPDKETAHMITLNENEYAIGTYSNAGGDVPLFTSIRFTEVNTIVTELYASSSDEEKFRSIFESLLSSITINSVAEITPLSPIEETLGIFLVNEEDLTDWSEQPDNNEIYDDGICRILIHKTLSDYVLVNCIIFNSPSYNLNVLRDYYTSDSENVFVDLEEKSKYTYDNEFDLYAFLDSGGFPKYTLLLETDEIVYSIALITPHFRGDTKIADGIPNRFNDEIDDLLHEVILLNLEKSK